MAWALQIHLLQSSQYQTLQLIGFRSLIELPRSLAKPSLHPKCTEVSRVGSNSLPKMSPKMSSFFDESKTALSCISKPNLEICLIFELVDLNIFRCASFHKSRVCRVRNCVFAGKAPTQAGYPIDRKPNTSFVLKLLFCNSCWSTLSKLAKIEEGLRMQDLHNVCGRACIGALSANVSM